MADKKYNIVFSGQVVAGANEATVKENLARVFKMDAGRVEQLFSGRRVVLKKDADQATAMKFRAVMKQAGAQCEMEIVGADAAAEPSQTGAATSAPSPAQPAAPSSAPSADPRSSTAETTASASRPSAAATAAGDLQTVGTIRMGGTGFSGEFDVAPVGSDLEDAHEAPVANIPDISQLSMAPVGVDLTEEKQQVAAKVPDISHLSVAEPGADLSDKK